jgi:hypothetical protein
MEAMLAAAKVMAKPKMLGGQQVAGEAVPADVVEEYARQLLEMTPEDFANHLQESAGMRFHSDPAGISNAALRWLRAGYQPW